MDGPGPGPLRAGAFSQHRAGPGLSPGQRVSAAAPARPSGSSTGARSTFLPRPLPFGGKLRAVVPRIKLEGALSIKEVFLFRKTTDTAGRLWDVAAGPAPPSVPPAGQGRPSAQRGHRTGRPPGAGPPGGSRRHVRDTSCTSPVFCVTCVGSGASGRIGRPVLSPCHPRPSSLLHGEALHGLGAKTARGYEPQDSQPTVPRLGHRLNAPPSATGHCVSLASTLRPSMVFRPWFITTGCETTVTPAGTPHWQAKWGQGPHRKHAPLLRGNRRDDREGLGGAVPLSRPRWGQKLQLRDTVARQERWPLQADTAHP